MKNGEDQSSFRDPSGSVYYKNNVLYRSINHCYKDDYDLFINSGLYDELVSIKAIIPHIEIDNNDNSVYKIIKPEIIPFISFPYEWCFSQLKEAALLTLKIQKTALKYGMSLKDSSAYNIQFLGYKPVFIDTLSFEKLVSGKPWVAYRQFCKHFLAPLALMGLKDVRLGQLLKSYIDGLPLDLTVSLLPYSARLNFGLFLHFYLHSKAEKSTLKTTSLKERIQEHRFGIDSFYGLIDSFHSAIRAIKGKPFKTSWSDYYQKKESYSPQSLEHKKQIIEGFAEKTPGKIVCSLGANIGLLSRIFSKKGFYVISSDFDSVCVEESYLYSLKNKEENILSLILDVVNPTPGIGWDNKERSSFIERGPFDLVIALALIHHLAITCNIPFRKISEFLKQISKSLIIEFVPKDDLMVKEMLSLRKDIFKDYTQEHFEREFSADFIIEKRVSIKGSKRILYLMRKRE